MIVDEITASEGPGGLVARTATVRCADGSASPVSVVVPAGFAPEEADDATGILPLALLIAMRLGEDLEIEGRVDALLLARAGELRDYFRVCGAGRLRDVEVRTAGTLPDGPPPCARAGAFLSRGVDSLHQAARGLCAGGGLDALVFVDRFEPVHDDTVRERERDLAREAAGVLGLPLVVAEAPLRGLADPLFDWEDAVGGGLAWAGHALSGGLGRLVIPSTDSVPTLAPCGHGPAVDPLFSSRRLRFEHADVTRSRMGKVQWLASQRPDLLPLLKVCFSANRPDNCGRCGKCLHTMACLRAAGALEQATGFPPQLDVAAFAAQRHGLISVMVEMAAVRDAAREAGDAELAAAAQESLTASAPRRVRASSERPSFRGLHSAALLSLLRHGDAPPESAAGGAVGLVRAVDLRGRRHVHGAGWRPPGDITAELGALRPAGGDARVPLWVLPDGRVATREVTPRGARPALAARGRHALAPLAGDGGARRAARRALDLAAVRPLGPAFPDPAAPPHGFMYAEPGERRVALWAGEHPVTGDQYTAASAAEVTEAGFASPRLLGHLDAHAPLTGLLGPHAMPVIPWA